MKLRKTQIALFGLAALALQACGGLTELKNRRTLTGDANALPIAFLDVSGLQDGGWTNSRVPRVKVHYKIPSSVMPKDGNVEYEAKLILSDAKGKAIWEKVQKKESQEWEIPLTGKEGSYTLEIEPKPLEIKGLAEAEPWKAKFKLDVTQPNLAVNARLVPSQDSAQLALKLRLLVNNEESLECEQSQLEPPKPREAVPFKLKEIKAKSGLEFEAESVTIDDIANATIMVSMKCKDAAGNPNEIASLPLSVDPRDFNLGVSLPGEPGQPIGDTETVHFVKSGQLQTKLNLLSTSDKPLPQAVVESERARLLVFVTEVEPTSAADLTSSSILILWREPFTSTISPALPSHYDGKRRLYFSLVRTNQATSEETLVNSVPAWIFVDNASSDVSFLSKPKLTHAIKDRESMVSYRVKTSGAPIKGLPSAEYSSDGTTWLAIPVAQTSTGTGGTIDFEATVKYPFDEEKPFRLRLIVTDLAGNKSTSLASPSLFARPGIDVSVPAAERANCASKSNIQALLASRFVCEKPGVDIESVNLVMHNRGASQVQFFSTSLQEARLWYQIMADGVRVASSQLSADDFKLQPTDVRMFNLDLPAGARNAQKIEVIFDMEENGPHSTSNSCNAGFPKVVIQDKANALTLGKSAFDCDPDMLILP